MPSEHSEPQRAPAWPEVPPAWPEVPAASPFTPSVRSFSEAAPPHGTGEHPVLPPPLGEPPATQYASGDFAGSRSGTDPFSTSVSSPFFSGSHPVPPPPAEPAGSPYDVGDQRMARRFGDSGDRTVSVPPPQERSPFSPLNRGFPPQDGSIPSNDRAPSPPYDAGTPPNRPRLRRYDTDPSLHGPGPTRYDTDPPPYNPGPTRYDTNPPPYNPGPTRYDTDPSLQRPDPSLQRPDPSLQRPGPSPYGSAESPPYDAADATMVMPPRTRQPDASYGPATGEHRIPPPTGAPPLAPPQYQGLNQFQQQQPQQQQAAPHQQPPHQQGPQQGQHQQPPHQQGPQQGQQQRPPQQQQGHQHQFPQQPPQPPQPDDPYKPFVTAGQISGPKTPPAHRQQELWNTVFGEDYRAIDEYDEEEERGRPIWLFALIGSVVVALVGALVWAFVAGPLSSGDGSDGDTTPVSRPVATKSPDAAKPQSQVPTLPKFKGTASPVSGVVTDATAKVTLPRLGGPWQLDLRTAHIQTTYGFTTRQYVSAGMTNTGKPQFAQVMSGPLPQALAAKYTTPDNLNPVISGVAFQARQKLFPKGNKSTKIAQQNLSRNGMTGRLVAYEVSDDAGSTTVVVAAFNTGADLPSIVYMQVPDVKDDLLPDINTIFKSIKLA